jgi:uncharacterized protein (TIGR02246 family)
MKKLSLYLAAFALAFTACQPAAEPEAAPAPDMAAIQAEIQAMEDAYAAAENAKDVEGILVYYSDDAVSLAHEKAPLVGKEAIRADLTERMADTTRTGTVSFKVENIMLDGDLLVETGSSATTDKEGMVKTGKYISIFQKRDGKWVCVRDIWNADAPEAPATEAAPM